MWLYDDVSTSQGQDTDYTPRWIVKRHFNKGSCHTGPDERSSGTWRHFRTSKCRKLRGPLDVKGQGRGKKYQYQNLLACHNSGWRGAKQELALLAGPSRSSHCQDCIWSVTACITWLWWEQNHVCVLPHVVSLGVSGACQLCIGPWLIRHSFLYSQKTNALFLLSKRVCVKCE